MVLFEYIKLKNFMSVGNAPITITLNKHHTTLVTATNGSGKSAIMLDSICFGLFGKAYRNINKPNLVNSINQKKCTVEVGFSVGKRKYRIVRGMKPNIFEIYENDTLINQDPNVRDYQKVLEQQILKMNYRAFTQVVVMGSAAYVPFMKLAAKERREFIEDLLDIRVFSVMNKLLSVQMKETKETMRDMEAEITSSKEIIKVIEGHVASKKTELQAKVDQCELEKKKLSKETKTHEAAQQLIIDEIATTNKELDKFSSYQDLLDEIKIKRKKVERQLSSLNEDKHHHETVDDCPTCTQKIQDDIRHKFVSTLQQQIGDVEKTLKSIAADEHDALEAIVDSAEITERLVELNKKLGTVNEKIYGCSLLMKKLNRERLALEDEMSVESPDKSKLREVARKIVNLDKRRKELLETQQIQTVAQVMLQDTGIKSKIIKQYIPTINKMVNKYLNQLELFVNFNLDENFNEVIKSRHRDTFTYDSFSQGEKQRIDLSLVFTWRAIAAMKNSVNTNLIILDEVADASMDDTGFEQCVNLLNSMKNNNIFVVSHRGAIADKFHSTLKLVKKNNFTEVE